jgi:hypothetical protein
MKVHPWTTISGIFREMSGTSQPLGPQFWSILVNPWDPKLAKIRTRPHGGLSGGLLHTAKYRSTPRRTPRHTPRSIVELTEVAEQSLDDVLPSITWVRMAENARREAESFYEQGEFESAFIEFTRAVTILRDKIPTPDNRSPLTSTGRYHISTVSHLYSLVPRLLPLVCLSSAYID